MDESVSDTSSECGSEANFSSEAEVDLDPASAMLYEEVRSGRLPTDHIFYRLILNELKFARQIGNPKEQFQHDNVLRSFCESICRNGHMKTFNLLTGKRMLNKGRGSAHSFTWQDYNIPLPPPRKNPGYTYENGVLRAYLLGFLQLLANDESPVASLLNERTIKVVPVSMAKDGLTLKPGFQADPKQLIVVGGLETYSLEYITENQIISPEFFKDKFVTEAEIMGITTLDYKLAVVLGSDFVNNSGTGQSTFETHLKRLKELQQCKSCLEREKSVTVAGESCTTSECPKCTENRSVCHECKAKGQFHWNPMLRQCDECSKTNSQCVRLACFNLTTDSLQIFKTAMELISQGQENGTIPSEAFLASPNPDLVHSGKNIHRSHGNWFLFVNQARFSLVMLRTARLDSAAAESLKTVLTDKALRGRDRMDTTYVAECTSPQVVEIVRSMNFLVHTIIPEMYWKEYGPNKPGAATHPLAVCLGSFGTLFFVDYTVGCLFKARLHNPVELERVTDGLAKPTGVVYMKGVVYVAEEAAVTYVDVGGVVKLKPSRMRKPQLVEELNKRGLLQTGEHLTVAQMKERLASWMNENIRNAGKMSDSQVLVDGLSPMALTSDEKTEVLFLSQRNSNVILKVTVKSNGLALQAQTEEFVSLPGSACVTGLAINNETNDLCVADSSPCGGIYVVDLKDASFTKIVKNGTPSLRTVYDIAVTSKGRLVFSDVGARKVGRVDSGAANYIVGSGIDSPEDGCEKTASFVQPTGICAEGETIFLTDTGAAAVKIISPTEPLADFLHHNSMLYTSHGIHSNRHPSLPEAISLMGKAVSYFEKAITAARAKLDGRTSVEGPHGVPSSKTISGTRMTLEALKRIKSEIEAVNPDYVSKVDVKALVTLLIEHFNSKMRSIYDMPTVQQFCYQFSAAVEETLKRISNCGFSYFTSRDSYYDVPEGMVVFEEIPKVPCPVTRKGRKEDVAKIREWARTYGDSTRQLSVRARSTKDNPGTLPISAYGRRTLPNNPASLDDLTERLQEADGTSEVNVENVAEREDTIGKKDDVVLITRFERISGPFILGKLAQNLKRTTSKVKTHLYGNDPEDCLMFNYEFTALVERQLVIGTVGEVEFTDEDFHIDLNQELYEECLERTRGVQENDIDEEELQEEQDPRVRRTSSGRALKLPDRFY